MYLIIIFAFVALLAIVNLLIEYSRDLMMMQQNSYRIERFRGWLRKSGESTSYPKLLAIAVILLPFTNFGNPILGSLLGVFALVNAIRLARKKYKKPLVWTPRVRRIFSVMLTLSAILIAVGAIIAAHSSAFDALFVASLIATALYAISQIVTIVAVWLLKPVENKINKGYYDDARRIITSVPGLKVIGITGSYGKTSTKHYLHRILSEHYETLMTPGSYNTTMGVIRTIREMMKPYTEVFICEMGAKQKGDIKEICDLVSPQMGIITAVGPMHLETFGSIENVQATKFELVDALPGDGVAVINNDFEYCANRPVDNVRSIRYGFKPRAGVDYYAEDVQYSPFGSRFAIRSASNPDFRLQVATKLVGECNISNLIAAVIVALHLDVPEAKILRAIEHIQQVEHRLSMKRTPGGVTIIDDAFNSNPTGSAMALDVLASMTSGKRIVVTPGMIELGDEQFELNRRFGEKIASSADVAIIVGEYNRDAINEGIAAGQMPEDRVYNVADFNAAQQRLALLLQPGDTILYENDLPDTFK